MDQMLSIAKKQGIVVKYHDFANSLKGIYFIEPQMPPIIGLNKSLKKNIPLLRCVMAEELGHHFTTVGNQLPREFYHYAAKLTVSKAEHKALRWAANYLMPLDRLRTAIENGIIQTWELAEHFSVTEIAVQFRLRLPDIHLEFSIKKKALTQA